MMNLFNLFYALDEYLHAQLTLLSHAQLGQATFHRFLFKAERCICRAKQLCEKEHTKSLSFYSPKDQAKIPVGAILMEAGDGGEI
jgi:hypothetical protein